MNSFIKKLIHKANEFKEKQGYAATNLSAGNLLDATLALLQLDINFIFFLSPTESHSQFFNPEDSYIENAGDATLFLILIGSDDQPRPQRLPGHQIVRQKLCPQSCSNRGTKFPINKERPFQGGGKANIKHP